MELSMSRVRWIPWIGIALLLVGCTQKSGPTKPKPTDPPLYGALVVPKISSEVDPYLLDAYQALDVDGNQIGHIAISWADVERGPAARDWSAFDPNVEQARRHEMKLSVVVEFVHGGETEAPSWRWPVFPDWDDPDLRTGLAQFLRELAFRADGTIAYLWLGEGPDRTAALYGDSDVAIAAFYAAIADSARAAFPGAAIGTVVSPRLLAEDGREQFVRGILGGLDLIGICVSTEAAGASLPTPEAALDAMRAAIAPWEGGRFAILEAGYPSGAALGSSEAAQAQFASLAGAWLHSRPSTMDLFSWAAIHDPSSDLADSLGLRRFPNDSAARAAYAARLGSIGLRRLDGSPKPARQTWLDAHP
jgi:hypothetical protein